MPSRARRAREELVRRLAGVTGVEEVITVAEGVLRLGVGADGGAWSTVDPATLLGTSCLILADMGEGQVRVPEDPRRERLIFEIESADDEPNTFASMWREGRVAAGLVLDVPNGERSRMRRVREVMNPLGATDELRVVLADHGLVWGTAVLYRFFGSSPFGSAETTLAAELAPVIARALRRAVLRTALESGAIDQPPGTVVVSGDDVPSLISTAAETLLGRLGESHARTAIARVVAETRARGECVVRAIGEDGPVVLHGSAVKGTAGAVAVIVEHPRFPELAELVVAGLELTPREAQVAAALLRGAPRGAIALDLGISVETVADVAGRVYRKAGVGSAGELRRHVDEAYFAPRRASRRAPGPYGFFLDVSDTPTELATARATPRGGDGARPRPVRRFGASPPARSEMPHADREDLLSHTHAALRHGLFELTLAAGAIDWTEDAQRRAVQDRWSTLHRLLAVHAEHEDRLIYPLVVDTAGGLIDALSADHRQLEDAIAELDSAFSATNGGVDHGADIYRLMSRFTARYLDHLEDEETRLTPSLLAACNDNQLRECRAQIIASTSPGDLVELQVLLLPSVPVDVRRSVIGAGRAALPPPALKRIGAVLKARLPGEVWASVSDLFDVEASPA